MRSNRKARFDDVYQAHKDYVFQVAYLITKNLHTAEDITQEVFIRYYLYTASSEVEATKTWLATLSKNLALNSLRIPKHEESCDINEKSDDFWGTGATSEEIFFNKLWRSEWLECSEIILCALKKKNPLWYDAITYVYGMERRQKDVADAMGITMKSLDGMLTRAKNWIRKNYKDEYDRINYK